jgi:hypothetical protein
MKKSIFALFGALSVLTFVAGCGDDDSSSDKKKEPITEVNSIYELGLCGEENKGDTVYAKEQEAEYFCDGENWAPVATDDESSSSDDKEAKSSSSSKKTSAKSSSSKASEEELKNFAKLCEASGGKEKDGVCICSEEVCDIGSVCNTMSKKCANNIPTAESECDDSYKSKCSNSPTEIGIVKECVKGVLVNRSCNTVSCNEKGTDCGECINDVQTCTENKKFKATVTRCENGKKVTETCGDNSCDPRDNGCGECTNY